MIKIRICWALCWSCDNGQCPTPAGPHTWLNREEAECRGLPWPLTDVDRAQHPCCCGCAPQALRPCGFPGCPDQLDIVAVMSGTAPPRGWVRNRLVEYLCAEHGGGAHVPGWERFDGPADGQVQAVAVCSCGWRGTPSPNLAGAHTEWSGHASERVDSRAADQG